MESYLLSNNGNVETVPESYVLPPERRPGKPVFPLCNSIPVIDFQELGRNRRELIQQIIEASQEYGFFQLINHGVSNELMDDVLKIGNEFFELSYEEKIEGIQFSEGYKLRSSIDYSVEKVHFWRDNFQHPCLPLEQHIQQWPKNPPRYRDVVGRYSVEVRRVGLQIMELIGEGLGLGREYFEGELTQKQVISFNHYPPCPDPSLVLGLPKHGDPYLLTLLNQGHVLGLHVFKDEEWLLVEPIPNAFVVNINQMLQVISNGKLKSADHRVVTNSEAARITAATFILFPFDICIEPAKKLINEHSPPLYKPFMYTDYAKVYLGSVGEEADPLHHFMVGS